MTEKKVLFREVQRFRQVWVYLLLFGLLAFILFNFIRFVWITPAETTAPSAIALAVSLGIIILVILLFFTARLTIEFREDGIYFRFFPFHLKFKPVHWKDISEAYVRKYSPIRDYGGWGLRFSLAGKGRAYNVAGNRGLQLKLKNGKQILLGTQMPDKVSEALLKSPLIRPE